MPSPGPTETMLARQVRMGDVVYVADVPHAVIAAHWFGYTVIITLDDGGELTANLDDPLDVTRPFSRHAEAGEHDT